MADTTTAPVAENPVRDNFRAALRAIIARVGFPHEQDVNAAYDAVDEYLGVPVNKPPFAGPWFDPATGAYIGPADDPHNPNPPQAAASDVAPAI